jgi:hypothetical protein
LIRERWWRMVWGHRTRTTRALKARAVDWWLRPGGCWLRRALPSAAPILARIGELVVVCLLVAAVVSMPAEAAGGRGPAVPDPAPQPIAPPQPTAGSARGSAAQPRPQTAPRPLASSPAPGASQRLAGGSSPTPATHTQSGSSGAAVPARALTRRALAVRRPVRGPRSPRRAAPRSAQAQSAEASAALALAGIRDLPRLPTAAALTPSTSRHNGDLLLLSSLALAALVIASLVLLRRVARLRADGLAR